VAKRWRFPEASGGTDISYPFRFLHGYSRRARSHRYKRNRGKSRSRAHRRHR
jgi:hypothetical protein